VPPNDPKLSHGANNGKREFAAKRKMKERATAENMTIPLTDPFMITIRFGDKVWDPDHKYD
jgi:hypothetical protein